MAKTFDNISEASATNYLFLFAQRTLGLQEEPPTPPPLNALGLPYKAISLLRDLRQKKDETPEPGDTTSKVTAVAFDFSLDRRTFLIAPLAKQITDYIIDHQDDAAQEDRWRTTMKREMVKNFREQRKAIDKQSLEVQTLNTKMDETIQLVKDFAKPPKENTEDTSGD